MRHDVAVPEPTAIVAPTLDDTAVAVVSDGAGGRIGCRAASDSWWTPLRVAFVVLGLVFASGVVLRAPCASDGFRNDGSYIQQCYSDIGQLYLTRDLRSGTFPYADDRAPGTEVVEYPVLQAVFMWGASFLVPDSLDDEAGPRRYYGVTALLLLLLAMVTVWAVSRSAGARPWDALIVAAAPSVALVGTLNWDFLAMALLALAILAWSRNRPWLAGVLIGLGGAAKLYPLLLLGALFVLCLRAGTMKRFAQTALAAAGAWAAVNIPVALATPDGWGRFFELSRTRPFDFGSIWLAVGFLGVDTTGWSANTVSSVALVTLCLAIAVLVWTAPRRARLPQVALLVVAAFLLATKVYSPQFALWLLPLAALARPRWRDILIWQGGQAIYYVSVWLWLNKFADPERALSDRGYAITILIAHASTLWLCAMVVRDIWRPECDPVRTAPDGSPTGADDPAGGCLDHRADAPGFPRGARDAGSGEPVGEPTTYAARP
jgi:uncharacterized membrane protein